MGLEPTTFAVTGRCSNQLRYNSGFIWQKARLRYSLKSIFQVAT